MPGLTELSRRLDGHPLLLELAVAPARLLGADRLLERLSPDLLQRTGGPERHRGLQASVAWSLDQLSGEERAALHACAVFAGPFTLETAEVVVGLDLGVADRLVAHHLLRVTDGRLSLWPLVCEVLGAPSVDVRRAHLEWMSTASTRQAARTRGPGGLEALDWLEGHLANLVEAFEHGLVTEPWRAVAIAWALDPLLERRGFAATRLRLSEQLADTDDWRARVVEGRTWRWRGELDRARQAFERVSEDEALARGHRLLGLLGLAGVAVVQRQPSVELYTQAVEAFDEAGERALARRTRALLAPFAEDDVMALEDVLAEHRACSDPRGAAIALGKLAGQHVDAGRQVSGLARAREAQELSAALGDSSSWAVQGGAGRPRARPRRGPRAGRRRLCRLHRGAGREPAGPQSADPPLQPGPRRAWKPGRPPGVPRRPAWRRGARCALPRGRRAPGAGAGRDRRRPGDPGPPLADPGA
ncbi:MAG: hypothetical protein GY913_20370 [Proteobacteria bacterium]|nr:hypothetical protein [Pseudomonadota bacterium]MCP4919263.1 hypothetical protein [Pseudomonadota bacterium]